MESDDTPSLSANPDEDLFEFGDQTICRMRRQPFDLAGKAANPDDLGTMIVRPFRQMPVEVREPDPAIAVPEACQDLRSEVAQAIHTAPQRTPDVDDLGTMVVHPAHRPAGELPADPIQRLEAKVDALTRAVEGLRKTLASIQEALPQPR